jgi:hypothetical protein
MTADDLAKLSDEDLNKAYLDAIEAKRAGQALENAAGDELSYRMAKASAKAVLDALEARRKASLEPAAEPAQEPVQ